MLHHLIFFATNSAVSIGPLHLEIGVSARRPSSFMQANLRGKIVIITGASSGIGKCITERFAGGEATLVLAGRNGQALRRLSDSLKSKTAEVTVESVDVTDPRAVQDLVRRTEERYGRIDVVVASAGEYVRVHGASVSRDDLVRSMNVNFFGTVDLILAAIPGMMQRKSGRVIAISSVDGKKALPRDTAYVSAKFAVTGFMDAMRQDLRGSGVIFTTVLPGRVDTPMIGTLTVPWISRKISPEKVADAVMRSLKSSKPEIIVPFLGPSILLWSAAISPRLADFLIRLFRLEGTLSMETPSPE
jgi:short-subunit dehydrogenase